MELKERLKVLCQAAGVAGEENNAAQVALEQLKSFAKQAYLDDFNNVIGIIREAQKGEPMVLIDAHIDEIGMVITFIDEEGFLHVGNCGGLDRRLLLGQEVTVLGQQPIPGIICTMPPHLTGGDEKKVPEMEDILIDIGMGKEQAEKLIRLGDRAVIRWEFRELLGNRISSKALDDRCGVAAILRALELLVQQELHCGLTVVFSAQEEVGEAGAKMTGYRFDPDIAIGLDVSFAKTPDAPAHRCGEMGKGPMIGIAPSLDRKISEKLIQLAQEKQIPYQVEVMNGSTGTNLDAIGIQRGGVHTGLISIPQKYMHTPVEVIDLDDLEQVAKLLSEYLLSVGGEQ